MRKTKTEKTPQNTVKKRKEEISIKLYKFRFLNRKHIQKFLNQKDWKRTIEWLNDLTKEKYVRRYYTKKIDEEPAFYSLGTMGRQYFLEHREIKDITIPLLDRVWREHKNSYISKKHWLFLADIYISLLDLVKTAGKGKGKLTFFTNVDLQGVRYIILPEPDAYFTIREENGEVKGYFLDIFDSNKQWNGIKERIQRYFWYFNKNWWEDNMKKPFPRIIFVTPDDKFSSVYGYIKKILTEKQSGMKFYLSTWSEIEHQGMNAQVLHKVDVV